MVHVLYSEASKSHEGPKKLKKNALNSMRTYPGNIVQGQNAVEGLVVAGPAVKANANKMDSALHPAWRKTLLHVVLAQG